MTETLFSSGLTGFSRALGTHAKAIHGERWGFLSTDTPFLCPHVGETEVGRGKGLPGYQESLALHQAPDQEHVATLLHTQELE